MMLTKADIDKVRNVEGFPIARDEDIIALSRPPYYTACPNPFIESFIQAQGTPYDEATDNYHREPFAADVSEGKNDPIYSAHGYHTKVPYKAIMRYILHYTKPGDLVYDGFCGTGMTGVAAQMCGCPEPAFKLQIEQEMKENGVEWGTRIPVLNDLSPAATFIAYNYNTPINVEAFRLQAERLLEQCAKEYGWMYQTQHVDGGGHPVVGIDGCPIMARLNYTVWADLIVCPSCAHEFNFFSVAQDEKEGRVKDTFLCPRCQALLKKTDCAKALETRIDPADGQPHQFTKQVPVLIEYGYQGKKYKKKPDSYDMEIIRKIDNAEYPHWFPTDLMMGIGEKWGDSYRSGYHQGVTRANHFYTKKSILAISYLWQEMKKYELSSQMEFMVDQIILGMSKLARYVPTHFSQVNQYLSGTLYIGSQYVEVSPWYILDGKVKGLLRAFSLTRDIPGKAIIETGSAETSGIPDDSIDYIFTDPPFGDNLMYSELNFLTEAWMKVITNNTDEAIVNTSQRKGVAEYQAIMEQCFAEYYRVLKPQRWITVEFHNSRNSVWNAIQEALNRVGFIVADVRTLDKKQGSFKQIVSASAVKQDLVISAYKPKDSFVREFRSRAGDPEMAWEFVRQHLHHVPVTADGNHDGKLDMIAERQDYLLFDGMSFENLYIILRRMAADRVSFNIQSSFSFFPTVTSVARQSVFSGKLPREHEKPFSLDNEEKQWRAYWRSQGYKNNEIAYIKEKKPEVPPQAKVAGIIINICDDLMHAEIQGLRGMNQGIEEWMDNGLLSGLIHDLLSRHYAVYMTSDHGNTAAIAQGRFTKPGLLADPASRRAVIYKEYADAVELAKFTTMRYDNTYLPDGINTYLFGLDACYGNTGTEYITHGGMTLEESIVPFVRIGEFYG